MVIKKNDKILFYSHWYLINKKKFQSSVKNTFYCNVKIYNKMLKNKFKSISLILYNLNCIKLNFP